MSADESNGPEWVRHPVTVTVVAIAAAASLVGLGWTFRGDSSGSTAAGQAESAAADDETTNADPDEPTTSPSASPTTTSPTTTSSTTISPSTVACGDGSTAVDLSSCPTTTAPPTTEPPGEDLIPLFVPSGIRCGWHNFNGRPWELDDDIDILGESFTGPSCWLGPKSAESSSYVEFDLGARFTNAAISVGVDSGVPVWGDPETASSAADAEFVYRFYEVSGSSERELHPEVIVSLGRPSTLTFDVTGVSRMRVFVLHSSGGVATVSVYDGRVT